MLLCLIHLQTKLHLSPTTECPSAKYWLHSRTQLLQLYHNYSLQEFRFTQQCSWTLNLLGY